MDDGGVCRPPDPLALARAACMFGKGGRVVDTLGLSEVDRKAIPIRHVIVMMKENRSFDHLLGALHDRGQPEVEPIPADFSNKDLKAQKVGPSRAPTTCLPHDPGHQWESMHLQVNSGAMDGFVKSAALGGDSDGHFVMGYYTDEDLPFYYWVANTFALNDRHFAATRTGTFPNRDFLLLGTADGVVSTGAGFPRPGTPTIFDALDTAGVTWGVYSDGGLLSESLNWDYTHKNTGHFADFLAALDRGTLPSVVFVDGIDNVEDEHPTGDMQQGEAWTRNIYQHALASRYWPTLAMIWTYDEAGGFFDHVPPPEMACIARPDRQDQSFFELGVRVPLAVISPWARPHRVSHVVEDHTAVTRFIETVFNLPALTARDANSTALLELFDFSAPSLMAPPTAPSAGTGGCKNGVMLHAGKPYYAPGDTIDISFAGTPGTNAKDWIGIYTYPAAGATPPNPKPLLKLYVGGTQSPTTASVAGTVHFDAGSLANATWPLAVGGYIAYYLQDDGLQAAASVDFNIR